MQRFTTPINLHSMPTAQSFLPAKVSYALFGLIAASFNFTQTRIHFSVTIFSSITWKVA